jgi:hypothetical protein
MSGYRSHDGSPYTDRDAGVIGPELERLAAVDVPLTAHVVVDAARFDASPLHPYFEWDDAVAAQNWRLWQARTMIGAIQVERVNARGEPEWVRAFHNVFVVSDERSARGYVTVDVATGTTEIWEQVVARALKEIEGWQQRYACYEGFERTFGAVAAAISAVTVPDPVT